MLKAMQDKPVYTLSMSNQRRQRAVFRKEPMHIRGLNRLTIISSLSVAVIFSSCYNWLYIKIRAASKMVNFGSRGLMVMISR